MGQSLAIHYSLRLNRGSGGDRRGSEGIGGLERPGHQSPVSSCDAGGAPSTLSALRRITRSQCWSGRKSQQYRTTPLLYLEEGDHWIVVASISGDDRHPDWWLNLKANPVAQIQIKRSGNQVRAREATEMERDRLWPLLVGMYSVCDDYQRQTSRKIPIVSLEPF